MQSTLVDPKSLVPVAVHTMLHCDGDIAFDLYLRSARNAAPVLYREKHLAASRCDFEALLDNGVKNLYVASAEIPCYEQYLRERVLTDGSISPAAHFCALREAHRSVFLASLSAVEVNQVAQVAQELGAAIARVVHSQPDVVRGLMGILRHDYYTYTHVTNVCVYSLALAQNLGIEGQEDLSRIAAGALLHDLGKRKIPSSVLNKNGRLSEEELALTTHPTTGFHEVCQRRDLDWRQLMMVYQHHERIDGSGYPVKISGDEILPWSRICTIADVYDAITSYRPYRRPMRLQEVCEFLDRNAGSFFDREMVQCWLEKIMPSTSTES